MKTTIELPDELLIAAKKRAAEERRPLRALVEQGIRAQLERRQPQTKRKSKAIRWVTVKGGLPPGLNIADRASMQAWIRTQK